MKTIRFIILLAALTGLGHGDGRLSTRRGWMERDREARHFLSGALHKPGERLVFWQCFHKVNQQPALARISKANDICVIKAL